MGFYGTGMSEVVTNWNYVCLLLVSSTSRRFLFELGTSFAFFFQQFICPGVALSKVLSAAQIPDKHEFTEFNSIARVSFTSLVANVVKILIYFSPLKVVWKQNL